MEQITLTRKEREKVRHKEEILRAALKLFSEKGFHNVSIQDIAAESEFAVGTLYNFFPGKEQLFTEMLDDCVEKIYQVLSPILESEQPEDEKLRTFIRAHGKFAEDNIEFIKLYVREYGDLTVSHNSTNEQTVRIKTDLQNKLEAIIRSGYKKKFFRPVDAKITSLAIIAVIQALIFEISSDFTKTKIEQELAKIEHLFIDSLLMLKDNTNA